MSEQVKDYKFRLYPSRRQAGLLEAQLAEAARLYNAALQERVEAWRLQRKRISYYSQSAQLKEIRASGDIGIPTYKVAADVLQRVDRALAFAVREAAIGYSSNSYDGWSDHVVGLEACEEAIMAGARIIEKHVCLENQARPVRPFEASVSEFKYLRKFADDDPSKFKGRWQHA